MKDILNLVGLIVTIIGLPVTIYTFWKSRQVQLTATAEQPIISFTPKEFPFTISIVNDHPRQARLDKIGFEVDFGDSYEVLYTVELLKITKVMLTDGEKIQIDLKGCRVIDDLASGIKRLQEKRTEQHEVMNICAWLYTSTGKRFKIYLSDSLKDVLHSEVRNRIAH